MNTKIALATAFDASFAAKAISLTDTSNEALLAIRLGDEPYALRLIEVEGLHVNRQWTPIPSGSPELLGLTTIRNTLLPIFDLGMMLGYPRAQVLRWIVVTRGSKKIGLAFSEFDKYLSVAPDALFSNESAHIKTVSHSARHYVNDAALDDGHIRPVIALKTLCDAIWSQAQTSHSQKAR